MRTLALACIISSLLGTFNWSLQKEIKGKNIVDLAPDQFGNMLIVDGDNLKKLDAKGVIMAEFSDPSLGTPSQITALDALNPIVFYGFANVLVTLDNRLNESIRTNLLEAGFYDITLVCPSDEERIWMYDQAQDKMFRYNIIQNKTENNSLNLTQLTGVEAKPTQLVSTFSNIYANVPKVGILCFTATGAFDKKIPLTNATSFDVAGDFIYTLQNSKVERFNTLTKKVELLFTLNQDFKPTQLKIRGNKLYLQSEKLIRIYVVNP